jgi:hypothetical protein
MTAETVPELAPSHPKRSEFQKECIETLRSTGMSEEEIARGLMSNPMLRSASAARVIADATKYRLATQARANAVEEAKRSKPVPKVMKPGASSARIDPADAYISRLSEEVSRTKGRAQIRASAELLKAQRRARG